MAQQPLVGQGLQMIQGLTITPRHTALGSSPLDEWSVQHTELWQQTQEVDIHAAGGIWTRNPSKRPETHASDRVPLPYKKYDKQ